MWALKIPVEVFIEKGFDFDTLAALRNMGHRISPVSGRQRQIFGGGQVIQRDFESGVLIAGAILARTDAPWAGKADQ